MREFHEVVPVQDTVCSGIAKIERLDGNMYRFWLHVSQDAEDGGPKDRIVVAKIVCCASVIPEALMQIIALFGDHAAAGLAPLIPSMMKN